MSTSTLILSETGYYQIEQSSTLIYPWTIGQNQWIKFTVSHTGFAKNQTLSMRFWCSRDPLGPSISSIPNANTAWYSPGKMNKSFAFWDVTSSPPQESQLVWLSSVAPNQQYWLDIQNMENRPNSFYLKIDLLPIS